MSGPLAFLLVMLGFGLRLDSTWQDVGGLLVVVGALVALLASGNAFVPDDRVR